MKETNKAPFNKDSRIEHLTDLGFHSSVIESSVPVLVDFWAPWCGPCRMLSPVLEKIAGILAGEVKVAKLNIDENPIVAQALKIQAIPMMALFNNGKLVNVITGVRPEQDILSFIQGSVE